MLSVDYYHHPKLFAFFSFNQKRYVNLHVHNYKAMRPQETVGLMVKATLLKKIIFFKKEVLRMYGLANSGNISENFRIFVVKLQKATERQPKKNHAQC